MMRRVNDSKIQTLSILHPEEDPISALEKLSVRNSSGKKKNHVWINLYLRKNDTKKKRKTKAKQEWNIHTLKLCLNGISNITLIDFTRKTHHVFVRFHEELIFAFEIHVCYVSQLSTMLYPRIFHPKKHHFLIRQYISVRTFESDIVEP